MKKKNNKNIKNNNLKEKINTLLKENYKTILSFSIGLLIGFCMITFFIPERIAKLENNQEPVVNVDGFTITADDYYKTLKETLGIELLIQDIDYYLLNKLYETTDEIDKEINDQMTSLISEYSSYYGYTEKQFLEANGFKDKESFYKLLLIDYKRNLYYEDYIKTQITNDEIKKYYNKLNPDIEIKYIVTNDEKTSNNILKDLQNGEDYNKVVKKYKNNINTKDMGYVAFDSIEINQTILQEAYNLKNNSFSKKALTSNNEYIIIFRGNSKEKEKIDNLENRIIEKIKEEKINNDTEKKIYYQSLINLRKENNINFKDTTLEKEYNNYIKAY